MPMPCPIELGWVALVDRFVVVHEICLSESSLYFFFFSSNAVSELEYVDKTETE